MRGNVRRGLGHLMLLFHPLDKLSKNTNVVMLVLLKVKAESFGETYL
jgi:hypothetical protein